MTRKEVEIIEEAEDLKDIYWYLKGQLSADDNSVIREYHIKAIESAIRFIYDNSKKKTKEASNE